MVKSPKMPKIPSLPANSGSILMLTVIGIFTQVCLLFVGKYLWNKYLVDVITFIRPMNSIISFIALIFVGKLILF